MIDLIVPIYDGLDETKKCINSILKAQNDIEYQVILINDCSPDKNLTNMLINLNINNVIVLNNDINMGFVKTCNKGLTYSNNDVILLNSDTIVTNRWIDKLYSAAYSNKKIGTVTALTNNGTIASVPNFNQDNDLPKGFTVQKFANLIESVSIKKYPSIPTAVGHAMYIKRELINKIGLLDEDSFGKGYGEEIDFSCRAIRSKYKNILADDTFIYHYGSTSFKTEKSKLIAKNKKILYKKHWWYPFHSKKFFLFDRAVKQICATIKTELNKDK